MLIIRNRTLTTGEKYVVDSKLLKKIKLKTWNSLIIQNAKEIQNSMKNVKK